MHARELVELAALVTSHGPALVASGTRIPHGSLEQYWAASRSRLDHWAKRLKVFRSASQRAGKPKFAQACSVIEEIVLSEALARTWTAVLHAYDEARQAREAEPIARSALLGHLEIRNRALATIVESTVFTSEEAKALNRLRRRVERWTDCLLSFLLLHCDVSHLAVEAERVRDFAEDLRHQMHKPGGQQVWPLTLVALKGAFQVGVHAVPVSPEHNARIASSILACLPSDVFETSGVFQSLWLVRLTNAADDAQGMIAELLGEAGSGQQAAGSYRRV